MSDLTTQAGWALLAAPWMLLPGQPLMKDSIAAIEAEARRDALDAVRAAVEPFYSCRCGPSFTARGRHATSCDAETVEDILAVIDELAQP